MRDLRVVHDQCGIYSDWIGYHEPIQAKYWHEYLEGKREPHYPVPSIPYTVDIEDCCVAVWDERNGFINADCVLVFYPD